MNNWKHYAGSVLLAGLLLQGCSSTPEDNDKAEVQKNDTKISESAKAAKLNANTFVAIATAETATDAKLAISSVGFETSNKAEDFMKAAVAELVENGTVTQAEADEFVANNDLNQFFLDNLPESTFDENYVAGTSAQRAASRGSLTDKLKRALEDLLDSKLGGKVTGAAFDVVLNSEGVTVVMLDMARGSRTITQIMIDAIGRNTSLFTKMCPMLQTNKEFGEKFAALAWEMYPGTKTDAPDMGDFFFSVVDAPLYGCLTDAMLLSNDDTNHDDSVEHSTTAYMGLLMERYADKFFIKPGTGVTPIAGYGSTDAFSTLMFDTGVNADYNSTNNSFSGHDDANERANEQLFYALFKTPGSTNSFVGAMENINDADGTQERTTMFMDKIFMGAEEGKETDSVQAHLNIIAIGSAMYDGIFGETNSETGVRENAYGFGSYTNGFIGFAKLIPSDRFVPYGKAFMDAGFAYAAYNGVNVWEEAIAAGTAAGQDLWNSYSSEQNATSATPAPARSAGKGTLSSDWFDDSLDIFLSAWSNVSLSETFDALLDSEKSVWTELTDQGNVAFSTVLDGRNEANQTAYPTVITNPLLVDNDTVYGFHGLLELAIREDIVNTQVAEGNTSYTMTNAKEAFALPLFADLTWSFAYNTASQGAVVYYNSFVDAGWLADLSSNELVRGYFYPSAENVYIPSWLLAIDWLALPENFNNASIADTDFNFDSGFMDIYVVTTNADLKTSLNLPQAADPLKAITMEAVVMGDDSIIVVDENGVNENGLYVYKVRVVSPEDTEAVLTYLNGLGDDVLAAIGIDSTNAADAVATAEEVQ